VAATNTFRRRLDVQNPGARLFAQHPDPHSGHRARRGFFFDLPAPNPGHLAGIANEHHRQAVLVADMSATTVEIWQNPAEAQAFVARVSPRLSAKLMLLDPSGHLIVSSDPNDAHLIGKVYEMPDLQNLLSMETPVEVKYKNSQIEDVIVPAFTSSGTLIGFVRLTNPLASLYARSAQLGILP
jgi:hypothetical protein